MITKLKKYYLTFKLSVQEIFEYRFDFFLGNFKYILSIVMMSFIWIEVSKNSSDVVQTIPELISYFILATLLYSLSNFHPYYVEEDIKLGGLSKYLLKPINPRLNYFAHELGRVIMESLLKMFIILPIFLFIPWQFSIGINVLIFTLYLPSIFIFSFLWLTIISQLSFWISEAYSIRWAITISTRLLAGLFAPLYFFPNWYQTISNFLPFQYLGFTPIQVIMGNLTISQSIIGLTTLWFWIFIAFVIHNFEWQKGIESYEGTGI